MINKGELEYDDTSSKWKYHRIFHDKVTDAFIEKVTIGDTQEEAIEKMYNILYDVNNPINICNKKNTLYELMEENVDNMKKANAISDAQYLRRLSQLKYLDNINVCHQEIYNITLDELQKTFDELALINPYSSMKKIKAEFNQAYKLRYQ